MGLAIAVLGLPHLPCADNLQSLTEATAYDRLLLGLRTAVPPPESLGPRPPPFDTNFPLGTALALAIPHWLGLDALWFGKLLSFTLAVGATTALYGLARDAGGPQIGTASAVLLWAMPSWVRGAVVSAEECAATLGVMGVIHGVRRVWEGRGPPGGGATFAAVAAALCFAVRLDALVLLPLPALLTVRWTGLRRAVLTALVSGSTLLLHLIVERRGAGGWKGESLAFLRTARTNFSNTAADAGLADLWNTVSDLLFGPGPALCVVVGATLLVGRGARPSARALLVVPSFVLSVLAVLTSLGAFEPRTARYLLPYVVPLIPALLSWPIVLARTFHRRAVPLVLGLFTALLVVGGAREGWGIEGRHRLPLGFVEVARAVPEHIGRGRVLVLDQHPAVVIEGRLRPDQVALAPPTGEPWTSRSLKAAARERRATLVFVHDDVLPADQRVVLERRGFRRVLRKGDTHLLRVP